MQSIFRIFNQNKLIGYISILLAIVTGVILGVAFSFYDDLESIEKLKDYRPNQVTSIYDINNEKIAEVFIEKRIWAELDTVPKLLIDTIVAVEDKKFFSHKGIRLLSILRAMIVDIRKGRFVQGGSTVTQQLAKLLFLTKDKRISRKIKEALIAIEIEQRFTKDEILTLYINQIYLGHGIYGFVSGARFYFDKELKDLTISEIAMLVAILKGPGLFSPIMNPENANKRRDFVIEQIFEENLITAKERDEALACKIVLSDKSKDEKIDDSVHYFVLMVKNYVKDKYGEDILYKGGLHIRTTLDYSLQKYGADALKNQIKLLDKEITTGKNSSADDEALQAALLSIRTDDGSIAALIGGRDFNISEFNRVTKASRDPGSAFKPIIYLTALENRIPPSYVVVDSPVSYRSATGASWEPSNYDNRFHGSVTIRKAIEQSLNIPAVKLLEKVGIAKVIKKAEQLGIKSKLTNDLTLALGSSGLTMLELASAYQAIANGGVLAKPYFIESIYMDDGNMLEENLPDFSRAVDSRAAFLMTYLLEGVVKNGTAKIASLIDENIAAKTGTSSNYRDSWFVGYSPEIVTAAWVGFDSAKSMGQNATGSNFAGRIWVEFMKNGLQGRSDNDFTEPEGIVSRIIDAKTGKLGSFGCGRFYTEKFIAGTEPVKSCIDEIKDDSRL